MLMTELTMKLAGPPIRTYCPPSIHKALPTVTVTSDPTGGTVKLAVVKVNELTPSVPATPGTFTTSIFRFGPQLIRLFPLLIFHIPPIHVAFLHALAHIPSPRLVDVGRIHIGRVRLLQVAAKSVGSYRRGRTRQHRDTRLVRNPT